MKTKKELIKELRKYKRLSYHDTLTGLYNRRKLEEDLDRFIYEHKRYKIRYTLLMLDINGFKKINDTYGHKAGDNTLKDIAKVLKKWTRKLDRLYRYGGDEFIVVSPHTTIKKAKYLKNRLQKIIPVTISLSKIINDKEQLLEILDKRLYERKRRK